MKFYKAKIEAQKKEIAERMAKARKAKGSLKNRVKRFIKSL